jgi:hypothetical protein
MADVRRARAIGVVSTAGREHARQDKSDVEHCVSNGLLVTPIENVPNNVDQSSSTSMRIDDDRVDVHRANSSRPIDPNGTRPVPIAKH